VYRPGPLKRDTTCSSGIPMCYYQDDLTATLSNNTGFFLLGKYKFAQFPLARSSFRRSGSA
jgi:hypothetical protein